MNIPDMADMKLNIYEKLNAARQELLGITRKKTGYNEYGDWKYMKLEDFLPDVIRLENKYKFMTTVSYDDDMATMTVVNTEMPPDRFEITSPMSTAKLKAAHDVQNLGAVLTYERRYLYLAAYNIIEDDQIDATSGSEDGKKRSKKQSKPVDVVLTTEEIIRELKGHAPKSGTSGDDDEPLGNNYISQLQKFALHRHSEENAAKAYRDSVKDLGKTGSSDLVRGDYLKMVDLIDTWGEAF